ncbi:MAG: hypothetical protein IJR96_09745 [Pseudobutyrivibrio sp.]|nr:hypothetical protein [Pseudobutyrivibrio sp.]
MRDKIIIEFCWSDSRTDIEVPLNITCQELIKALNEGIGLGIDVEDTASYSFICDSTGEKLEGEKTLKEFGLLDGQTVSFKDK